MLEAILALGYIGFVITIILIPLIATIILGVWLANYLGLTGIIWWAFLIVFYCIVSGLMHRSSN